MRIAIVASTDAYWTPLYARHFAAAGHDVRVFSLTPDPLDAPDIDLVHVCGPRPSGVPAIVWFLAQVPRMRRQLRRYAPDVVFATYMSSNGMVAALSWGGPLVVSGHGGDLLRQAGHLPGGPWLHRHMMRFECARAAAVHVVAEEMVETLTGYGVPRERISCFPLGVDVSQFERCAPAQAAATPHVVCTRRQEPVYANDVIVDALAILRDRGFDVHCTFVGGGVLLKERGAQVNARGLDDRVTFTGQVRPDEVRAILRSAHVYVSASTSDGTSSSLLEAMLCGAVPVVTRIRANAPWIEEGVTGLSFEIGDAPGLAAAIERAARDTTLRTSAAERNRALVERKGSLQVTMTRTLAMLAAARGSGPTAARQRRTRSRSTSKNGLVAAGTAVARPIGTAPGAGRIGISTGRPS